MGTGVPIKDTPSLGTPPDEKKIENKIICMQMINVGTYISGAAMAFLSGRAAHPEDQIEEENEEKLRKNERKRRRMTIITEIFLSCPPPVESLDTALTYIAPLSNVSK